MLMKTVESIQEKANKKASISPTSTVYKKDSEIAVSVSISEMRKELLKDIGNIPTYSALKKFLEGMVLDDAKGFKIFTGDQNTVNKFIDEINKVFRSQKIEFGDGKIPPEVIMSHIKKFLEIKNKKEEDEIFRKFYYYVKKVVSLEYKNLKHIPKRRYYNSVSSIEKTRKYLLGKIEESNHQHDFMYIILQIPVDYNAGIGLSLNQGVNNACLNSLSNILSDKSVANYLNDIISQETNKNKAFQDFLGFLESQKLSQNDVINKDFLAYMIRLVEIEYRGLNHLLKNKEVNSKIEKTLFPDGSPKIEDIKQGQLGDCYLLAALINIINKDSTYITNCFPEKDNYTLNQKTVKIQLNTIKVSLVQTRNGHVFKIFPIDKIIIEVDNTLLMKRYKSKKRAGKSILKPFGNGTKALWVNFIEKAFSVYKNIPDVVIADDEESKVFVDLWKKDPDHSLSGQNANGGWEFMPFSIITGMHSSSKPIKYIENFSPEHLYKDQNSRIEKILIPPFKYNYRENKVFEYIYYNLQEGKGLTAGTYSKDEVNFENFKVTGIYPLHAYSIQDAIINNSIEKKYIVLKNPRMKEIFINPEKPEEKMAKGTIKVELTKFIKYFKDINKVKFN